MATMQSSVLGIAAIFLCIALCTRAEEEEQLPMCDGLDLIPCMNIIMVDLTDENGEPDPEKMLMMEEQSILIGDAADLLAPSNVEEQCEIIPTLDIDAFFKCVDEATKDCDSGGHGMLDEMVPKFMQVTNVSSSGEMLKDICDGDCKNAKMDAYNICANDFMINLVAEAEMENPDGCNKLANFTACTNSQWDFLKGCAVINKYVTDYYLMYEEELKTCNVQIPDYFIEEEMNSEAQSGASTFSSFLLGLATCQVLYLWLH